MKKFNFIYIAIIIFFFSPNILLGLGQTGNISGISFVRINEPIEHAFSILIPKGWQTAGGIFRVNPLQAGGPLNSMEAKCNLIFKSDYKGTISFRIFPDIVYAHAGIGGGFFPVGSNYQGAEISHIVSATTFLRNIFINVHPTAKAVKILKIKRLPGKYKHLIKDLHIQIKF